MNKKNFTATILGSLLLSTAVFAQETNTALRQEREALRMQLQNQQNELRQNIQQKRSGLQGEIKTRLQNLRDLSPEERQNLRQEAQTKRGELRSEAQAMRQNLQENAKVLREGFREKVQSIKDRARIAAAHGKGLLMLNRFRSAEARFDHIIGRLESRVQKLADQDIDVSSILLLMEEAKNMSVQNQAKMEELKAKYESLLEGENPQGIGEGARQIAQELKAEAEKLHAKLKEIISAIKVLVPEEVSQPSE